MYLVVEGNNNLRAIPWRQRANFRLFKDYNLVHGLQGLQDLCTLPAGLRANHSPPLFVLQPNRLCQGLGGLLLLECPRSFPPQGLTRCSLCLDCSLPASLCQCHHFTDQGKWHFLHLSSPTRSLSSYLRLLWSITTSVVTGLIVAFVIYCLSALPDYEFLEGRNSICPDIMASVWMLCAEYMLNEYLLHKWGIKKQLWEWIIKDREQVPKSLWFGNWMW